MFFSQTTLPKDEYNLSQASSAMGMVYNLENSESDNVLVDTFCASSSESIRPNGMNSLEHLEQKSSGSSGKYVSHLYPWISLQPINRSGRIFNWLKKLKSCNVMLFSHSHYKYVICSIRFVYNLLCAISFMSNICINL